MGRSGILKCLNVFLENINESSLRFSFHRFGVDAVLESGDEEVLGALS